MIKRIFYWMLFLVACFFIYMITTFSIFDNENYVKLKTIDIPDKNYSLILYFTPSDASIQDAITVMRIENGKENLLETFPRYDYLENYKLNGNSELILMLKDTSIGNKFADTIRLKLP